MHPLLGSEKYRARMQAVVFGVNKGTRKEQKWQALQVGFAFADGAQSTPRCGSD
jgi:hypothetical protein